MRRIIKILAYVMFVLLFTGVSLRLFYPDFYLIFANKGISENSSVEMSAKNLVIGLDSKASELEPTFYDMASRNRLLQVYEPLLMPDKDLNFEPVLALNYGQMDDKTWKFRLRKGVKFHDGTDMTVDDVIASVRRAKNHEKSQLREILSSISGLKKISDFEFEVLLKEKDPLFLNRISTVLIFPGRFADGDKFAPMGTGPYVYVDENGLNTNFKRFESYWGDKPQYNTLTLLALDDLDKWASTFSEGDVQLAVSVPPPLASDIAVGPFDMVSVPSLSVTYLVFGFDSKVFENVDMREAVKVAINRSVFSEMSGGYLHPATQFVSGGVYGFNPDIEVPELNLNLAKQYVKAVFPLNRPSATLDLLKGDEAIGDYLKKQMSEIGIDAALNLLSREELEKKISSGESDMYVFGFRSELGDAYDFYSSAVSSGATYNGGNYSNGILNQKINESLSIFEPDKRLEILKEIMTVLVDEDIYGVPLFESQSVYAISDDVSFEPRIDGYVLAKEVK